ncbi:cell wall hydrolase [Mixta tenebrionis]|uniref:Cell wall hydrolase n=1 Tax=Mixta tenebrionis TaxID=2562439 RepID=A0A506V2Q0_9GAMM|nr:MULTISPECIES: cell wall hydrolase [Mixta]QHM74178.1 Spore cortex-lytic enzyme [Mixta theicola]TPW39806.1 cell wall hydrolase [Mixta tenebrionis]
MLAQGALLCLALNIYHEARGEPLKGQIAIASVTMNRANWDINQICPVVYAPKQFSWTHLTKTAWRYPPGSDKSWQRAQQIAHQIINGELSDVTNGATYYHNQTVTPVWRNEFARTATIGSHVFYARR